MTPSNVMAIDELLDKAREAKGKRDEAGKELAALVKALDGMAGIGMLDDNQRRVLGRLRPSRRTRRRASKRT
jgi:hypothetical protein